MLILTRRESQCIDISGGITITVVEIRDGKVRLGIEAPADVTVHRREVAEAINRQGRDAMRERMKRNEGPIIPTGGMPKPVKR